MTEGIGAPSYQTLLLESKDGVATLTLNRPERLNAFTPLMGEELIAVFRVLAADDNTRVVVLTGASRAFCAGADLELFDRTKTKSPDIAKSLAESAFVRNFSAELYDFPKPTIAAVNGPAIGIGVTMILPMDIRIAARSASFDMPFAKFGVLPGLGSAYLLPRLVGVAAAKSMMLGARPVSAEEAAAIGLVTQVTEDDRLLRDVHDIAKSMAGCAPRLMAGIKRLIKLGVEAASLSEFIKSEQAVHREFLSHKDTPSRKG